MRLKIRRAHHQDPQKGYDVLSASNATLYMGVLILILALFYLILNFEKADAVVGLWLPFMIAGVFLVSFSQIIKMFRN